MQTIQVVDTLAPVFTYVPEAVILECSEEISLSTAPEVENCWTQCVTFFEEPVEVRAGDTIEVPTRHEITKIYFGTPKVVRA